MDPEFVLCDRFKATVVIVRSVDADDLFMISAWQAALAAAVQRVGCSTDMTRGPSIAAVTRKTRPFD
jgi:hypothetical protein